MIVSVAVRYRAPPLTCDAELIRMATIVQIYLHDASIGV